MMKRMPRDAWHEALNGLAGPLLGSLGALAIWILGEALDSRPLIALAFVGFLINLFNLLPIVPLDGGRIVSAIHPAFWLAGLIGLFALVLFRPNPLLIVILIVAALELRSRWAMRSDPETQSYYRVSPGRRAAVALLYFGLAALLVLAMHETHVPRSF
jgi:Zn-dependent protease